MPNFGLGFISSGYSLNGGANDVNFTESDIFNGTDNSVYALAVQSDGKIIVGGRPRFFNGIATRGIVRLDNNMKVDTNFIANIGTGIDTNIDDIRSLVIQSDGKILVGGEFNAFNGAAVKHIVRLNTDGTRDTTFTTNNGTGFNSAVWSMAIQSDGKIVCVGFFSTFNGTTVNRIVRLNADGTRDATFTTGTGFNGYVGSVAIQSDGKILCGGFFSSFNGATTDCIVRLNSDGTRDTAFTTNTGSSFSGNGINSLAVQPDGKIICAGDFISFNGTTVNHIVRLNSDGTRDSTFTTNTGTAFNQQAISLAIQSDGKIVVGGNFTSFNGTTSRRIARLNSDGTLDTSFTANTGGAAIGSGFNGFVMSIVVLSDGKVICGGEFLTFNNFLARKFFILNSNGTSNSESTSTAFNGGVFSLDIQSDGKILCGGEFTNFNGITSQRIARLNSNGSLDATFTTNIGTGFNNPVNSIVVQSDGKVVICGQFTSFNGVTVNRIVRLNTDGTRDASFTTNSGTGFNGETKALAIQSDGSIIVTGIFTRFDITDATNIARLNSDGTVDKDFTENVAYNISTLAVAVQSDGKIVVGGSFTTSGNRISRMNADGSLDTTFFTNTGTGFNDFVNLILIQPDGKIVIGGNFTTFNGVTVNRIVRLNSNGTRDTAFTTNTDNGFNIIPRSAVIQSDGKILIAGDFTSFNSTTVNRIVRLNSDGTRDTTFTTNTGIGFDNEIFSLDTQPDGKVLCGGLFTSFNNANRTYLARIGAVQ